MNFCHLHVHDEYSQLDGYGSAKQYVSRAKEMGFKYLGLTNHGNIAGCLKFQKECLKQGIEPILGCELYIVPDAQKRIKEKAYHITILVQNLKGWTELCRILSYANLKGMYNDRPRIDPETLLNSDLSGWFILTACVSSFLRLQNWEMFEELHDRMKGRLFFEIMPHKEEIQKTFHKDFIMPAMEEYPDIPLIATNDCHYVSRGDWKAQDALLAIQRNAKWDDENRWRFTIRGLHLRSEKEMIKAFQRQDQFADKEIADAMANTINVAEKCAGFQIPKQNISFPKIPDATERIEQICYEKAFSYGPEYLKRYKYEAELIKWKGFCEYFMMVYDIVQWCNNNDIMVGPGRGSVGGSLLAYLLGITKVDPIKYDLPFARFISEDRIDYPDIDIDFPDVKRDRVIEYVEKKYGKNNVCGISTDMRMRGKGVIWDIGRVFKIPNNDIKKITGIIESGERDEKVVQKCFDEDGRWFAETYPEASRLAAKLENQLRSFGQHPAAVVISDEDLTDGKRCVLKLQKGHVVSSWDMEDCEFCGLMKLDVLGLSTLSVLEECRRLINLQRGPKSQFDFDDITFDDSKIFEKITQGRTSGIFQFSQRPTTELCKEMGIDCFNDMVAAVALARPGPYKSGMTGKYVQRKHGGSWSPMNKIYEEISKDTFGLLIYQEQVMQIISRVAGLPESTADKIRKVIGKKRDPKEFEKYRKQFLKGCKEHKTLSDLEAQEFWEGLLEWAGYGFNKAHSVEYSIIAYWTAWCKFNYPAEFICACLTYSKKDEKQALINEAQEVGLNIMLPKVDISDATKWIIKDQMMYVPFTEINSFGEQQARKYCESEYIDGNVGFFSIKAAPNTKTEAGKLLVEIGAYRPEETPNPDVIEQHFSFILSNVESLPILSQLMGPDIDFASALTLSATPPSGLIKPSRMYQVPDGLVECGRCELLNECDGPVPPSPGVFNAFITGEAPGPMENKYVRGFHEDAPAGSLLWDELEIYGLVRRYFHVTNICKCYPKKSKTPTWEHIKACSVWFSDELERIKPRLILALGNTCVFAFTGKKSGIRDLSGTTEWIEKLGAWVCWGMHPAAIKRRESNRVYFEKGIENFADKFLLLRGES